MFIIMEVSRRSFTRSLQFQARCLFLSMRMMAKGSSIVETTYTILSWYKDLLFHFVTFTKEKVVCIQLYYFTLLFTIWEVMVG